MRSLTIGERTIDEDAPCFIIAEAGSNHDGTLQQAEQLIDVAAEAGVDAIKFQFFKADKIAAKGDTVMVTDPRFTAEPVPLLEFYKSLEFNERWISDLKFYAESKRLIFMMTAFDEEGADVLEHAGIAAYKIASFEAVHLPLIRHIAKKGKPILLSTGMCDMEEIREAIGVITGEGNNQIGLFHCGIDYPMEPEDVHLASMTSMMDEFPYPIGYSDHTLGLTVPIAATALGAALYEKHFTIDRSLPGPDHQFALEPGELKSMVEAIRTAERALGSPVKEVRDSELPYYRSGRRSLFAARDIDQGETIYRDMIAVLRPGTGLKPKHLDSLIGKRAARDIPAHSPLAWRDIE